MNATILRAVLRAAMCLALVTAMVTLPAHDSDARGRFNPFSNYFWLDVLHNNDGESQLLPNGDNNGGVANFAAKVDELRAASTVRGGLKRFGGILGGSVLISSGDNILPSSAILASLDLDPTADIFDAVALRKIGYDALCIGNHEFDFGPDFLARLVEDFQGTGVFLSSNLDFSGEPALAALFNGTNIAESTVVTRAGRDIGIIGLTTDGLATISSPGNVNVLVDLANQVQTEVTKLEGMGVNIIILCSHLQGIDEDTALVPMLKGVDIVIAGGGDDLLANPNNVLLPGDEEDVEGAYPQTATDMDGKIVPVITTSGAYQYVGRLVVGFDPAGNVKVIDTANSGPQAVIGDNLTPDADIVADVETPVATFLADLSANIVATTEVPLESRRGNWDDVANVPALRGERNSEINWGNLIADAMLWEATLNAASISQPAPDVALQNGGGIRQPDSLLFDTAAPGNPVDVSERDIFDQLPFFNEIVIIPNVTHETLKNVLENAVSRVEFTDGRFAHIAGMVVEYDVDGTPSVVERDGTITTFGNRVRTVTLDSDPLNPIVVNGVVQNPAATLTVATNDFTAGGGDRYPWGGLPFFFVNPVSAFQWLDRSVTDYINTVLGGTITPVDYPFVNSAGDTTRIIQLPSNDGL